MSDPVKAPAHYAGDGVTTCEVAMASMTSRTNVGDNPAFWWQLAFKYVWRWPLKGNPIMDIDKAIESLTKLREIISEEVHEVDPR